MLMNIKRNHFDRYYCINSAQTREIMVHFILQSYHIFIRVSFLCSFRADFRRPVTSIHVLTARARVNRNINAAMMTLFINKQLLISCDTGYLCNFNA